MEGTQVELMNKYDLAEEHLKSFTRSKVRTKVFLSLLEGKMSASELEDKLDTRVTTVLHALKEMAESDLVEKNTKGSYYLTNLGKMQGYRLIHAINFALVVEEHKKFWLTHDISGIPPYLLENIGMLAQSEIIESDPASLLKAMEYFVSGLKRSNIIQGVSPFIIPSFPETIAEMAEKGAYVELILTDSVINALLKDYGHMIKEAKNYDNVVLRRLDEKITIGFTITDSFLSLGLYRIDGGYDIGSDLICVGDSAVWWGKQLFNYYKELSKPF
jgi:predicted transcriptional regulator